jgi:negative regulator of sigma E activity
MNCELCHELISDLLDGSLSREDQLLLNQHLEQCLSCAEVRADLDSIVVFSRAQRGEYAAPPNERAMWLRIRNTIEAEAGAAAAANQAHPEQREGFWHRLMGRSWNLSFPQLAASVAALAVVVSLVTAVGLGGIGGAGTNVAVDQTAPGTNTPAFVLSARNSQQQQAISYWNARVETNKARWNSQMRDTFDRNLSVIDQAVNDSLRELSQNPHDEVSEQMLNAALNEKIALLKEFSDL